MAERERPAMIRVISNAELVSMEKSAGAFLWRYSRLRNRPKLLFANENAVMDVPSAIFAADLPISQA
jgi:hypothetical protein